MTSRTLQISMPMGGIGAGCVCLNGEGGLQDWSIRHRPDITAMPDGHGTTQSGFALLHIRGAGAVTKLLEGPLPPEKIYDQGLQAQGYRHHGHEGMPRFESARFENHYPFGVVSLEDSRLPLRATITGWSPFIPLDDVNSGLPCAVLDYTFENNSTEPVEFDFSYHLSHLASQSRRDEKSRNAVLQSEHGGGVLFTNTEDAHSEEFGSAALLLAGHAPEVKAMWFRGGWFDALSALWREVSDGKFRPNDGREAESVTQHYRNGGSFSISTTLAPGAKITYPVVIAWHFPNSNQSYGAPGADDATGASTCTPQDGCCDGTTPALAWRPFYAGKWEDAAAVAQYVAQQLSSLRERTQQFADALWSTTLPGYVVDAVASNLAILKSPTVLRQENGNVWGWEGCFTQAGCCYGTCTHVWNYAQSMPHLFPALERTLREQELLRSMDEAGHVRFRAALPDGLPRHDRYAAADGQLGGILKVYRDFHISGDRAWLESIYPFAKRSLDYCIEEWDPNRQGALFEPHHNTYDIEFWGPDGMCGSIYIGALAAFAAMGRELGRDDEAAPYDELAARGAEFMRTELWNGEYVQQKVMWQELRDRSFAERIADVDESSTEELRLLQAEGPKYQYGTGCLSDGVIGAWMARIFGADTPMDSEHIRSTLRAIYANNFKPDLFDHACLQRPGYALGHEAGLLLCTWPRGGKPTLPFVYSDEVWTGIEYQVASHLIEEGLVEEGLNIVQAVRARYDGAVRNPFNEYECGNYYARAMASYALLGSLAGFRYSAASGTLWFGPRVASDSFRSFFSTATGYGVIMLEQGELTIELLEGSLAVQELQLSAPGQEVRCIRGERNVEAGVRETWKL